MSSRRCRSADAVNLPPPPAMKNTLLFSIPLSTLPRRVCVPDPQPSPAKNLPHRSLLFQMMRARKAGARLEIGLG